MPNTLAQPYMTTPDKGVVTEKKRMARAAVPDNVGQDTLSDVVLTAARRSHGKQGAAAAALGKDEGNFSRDTKALRLTLADLKALGAPFLASLGRELQEQFGQLSDPHDHADRLLLEAERLIFELKQYVSSRRVA
jgi:hypothetical protein